MTSSPEPQAGCHHEAVPDVSAGGRRDLIAIGVGALAATCAAGGAYTFDLLPGSGARSRRTTATGRIPDVPLLTHEGKRVRFYSDLVRDRTVFVSMMYAQCNNRCPPMTQNLKAVQEALGSRVGQDVFMYSITLMPEHDRPADLRAYMALHGVGPGWTFLTGERADVEKVRLALGFFDPDPRVDADLGQHIGMVRIGNDAVDRWCMTPILTDPETILESLMGVDPVSRAQGRPQRLPLRG